MAAGVARYVRINALEATYQDHNGWWPASPDRAVQATEANVSMLPKRAGEPAGTYARQYVQNIKTLRDQVAALNQVPGALWVGTVSPSDYHIMTS
jgi:hypothetical protein